MFCLSLLFHFFIEFGNLIIANHLSAIALKPDFAEAHYNLGLLLSEAEQYEKAVGFTVGFQQALERARAKPE